MHATVSRNWAYLGVIVSRMIISKKGISRTQEFRTLNDLTSLVLPKKNPILVRATKFARCPADQSSNSRLNGGRFTD